MNIPEQQLLEALRAHLTGGVPALLTQTEDDRRSLWALAAEQKVLAMAADALARADREAVPPEIRRTAGRTALVQLRRTDAFLHLWDELARQDLRPLVVKGLVCRQLYPQGELRPSADEDLLVREDELPALLDTVRRLGFAVDDPDAEQVIACRHSESGLYLELHRSLFPADSRAYGHLARFFSDPFPAAEDFPFQGRTLYTLSPGDHLLYLILHSFKHFLHSGFGVRQVCDICLFAAANGSRIPWEPLTEQLRQARAEIFAANLLEIGRRHLGLTGLPDEAEAWLDSLGSRLDCGDLLEDLLRSGVYGSSSQERLHSSRITLSAVSGEEDASSRRLLQTLFPARESLTGQYPWLREHPWLLPAAWCRRILRYGSRTSPSAARESLSIGEQRVELLKKYGVI